MDVNGFLKPRLGLLLVLASCVGTGVCAQVAPSSIPGAHLAGAGARRTSPVLEIKGAPVTMDDITSFSEMIQNSERGVFYSPRQMADEYIVYSLYNDLDTTVPVKPAVPPVSPSKYSILSQRSYLKDELQKDIERRTTATMPEMKDWYKKNIRNFVRPESVHAWHIFMGLGDSQASSTEAVRKRLLAVKKQADSGTSFSVLAKKYSEAESGQGGGEIGEITRRMPLGPLHKPMNINLENAFFKLKAGQVSEPVATSYGLHLLYVSEHKTTHTTDFKTLMARNVPLESVKREKHTSEVQALLVKSLKTHNGKILITPAVVASATSSTKLYELGGKAFTVADLENIYGEGFSRAFESMKATPQRVPQIMQQGLKDEAFLQAALDAGIDRKPGVKKHLAELERRYLAQKTMDEVIKTNFPISEKELKDSYEKNLDAYRRPEAEGKMIVISAKPSSVTAEMAHGRVLAREKAEELRKKIKSGADFEKLYASINADKDPLTSTVEIARHEIGRSMKPHDREFDNSIAALKTDGSVSEVTGNRKGGSQFVLLTHRYKGNPLPFEQVKESLRRGAEARNRNSAVHIIVKRFEKDGKVKFLPAANEELGPEPQLE